jgi:hypothetical protein
VVNCASRSAAIDHGFENPVPWSRVAQSELHNEYEGHKRSNTKDQDDLLTDTHDSPLSLAMDARFSDSHTES